MSDTINHYHYHGDVTYDNRSVSYSNTINGDNNQVDWSKIYGGSSNASTSSLSSYEEPRQSLPTNSGSGNQSYSSGTETAMSEALYKGVAGFGKLLGAATKSVSSTATKLIEAQNRQVEETNARHKAERQAQLEQKEYESRLRPRSLGGRVVEGRLT